MELVCEECMCVVHEEPCPHCGNEDLRRLE